jgi:hypothetical protein
MKKIVLIIAIALFASTSVVVNAQESVDKTDREMIEYLHLNSKQAMAYSAIMQKQRPAFLALKPHQWQQQQVLYEETFAMLKTVLDDKQYTTFVAFMDSIIEQTQDEDFLVMGE